MAGELTLIIRGLPAGPTQEDLDLERQRTAWAREDASACMRTIGRFQRAAALHLDHLEREPGCAHEVTVCPTAAALQELIGGPLTRAAHVALAKREATDG